MKPAPYGPFPYNPIDRRPKLELPNGARIAVWVVTNIEFFALDKPMPGDSNERPKPGDHTPMVRHWAQRDYGNRVGVFRMMEVLSAHGIRSSVALNAAVCDHHPQLVEDCVKLGWELLGHCRTNTERVTEVPPAEQRALIRESWPRPTAPQRPLLAVRGAAGKLGTLTRWRRKGSTYRLGNDDHPYPGRAGKTRSPAVFIRTERSCGYRAQQIHAGRVERMIAISSSALREGESSGRVMAIAAPLPHGHTHRSARAARVGHIGKFTAYKRTGEEISLHYLKTLKDYHIRIFCCASGFIHSGPRAGLPLGPVRLSSPLRRRGPTTTVRVRAAPPPTWYEQSWRNRPGRAASVPRCAKRRPTATHLSSPPKPIITRWCTLR